MCIPYVLMFSISIAIFLKTYIRFEQLIRNPSFVSSLRARNAVITGYVRRLVRPVLYLNSIYGFDFSTDFEAKLRATFICFVTSGRPKEIVALAHSCLVSIAKRRNVDTANLRKTTFPNFLLKSLKKIF